MQRQALCLLPMMPGATMQLRSVCTAHYGRNLLKEFLGHSACCCSHPCWISKCELTLQEKTLTGSLFCTKQLFVCKPEGGPQLTDLESAVCPYCQFSYPSDIVITVKQSHDILAYAARFHFHHHICELSVNNRTTNVLFAKVSLHYHCHEAFHLRNETSVV